MELIKEQICWTVMMIFKDDGEYMKEIKLYGKRGEGKVMIVDDCDFEKMNKYKWYYHDGYALAVKYISGNHTQNNIIQENIIAHRYVLNLGKGNGVVDHINHNKLDNRKENLRVGDYKQNSWNSIRPKVDGEYIGVRKESENCFVARYHNIIIGYYKTAKDAAFAYDKTIRDERGEYAVLNFPEVVIYPILQECGIHNKYERTSSITGISYANNRKAKCKWRVVKCKKHLGWFETESDAIAFLDRWIKDNSNADKK